MNFPSISIFALINQQSLLSTKIGSCHYLQNCHFFHIHILLNLCVTKLFFIKHIILWFNILINTIMKPNYKKSEGNKLIAIVGDEDTVTGFLLTGIGERNVRGETNYLIVDQKSTKQSVQTAFNRFLKDAQISVILITQEASDRFLRETISQREEIYPEKPYDPVKDVVMQRAHRLLYGSELSENS